MNRKSDISSLDTEFQHEESEVPEQYDGTRQPNSGSDVKNTTLPTEKLLVYRCQPPDVTKCS